MTETLKERLDRLAKAEVATNAKAKADPTRENFDAWERAATDFRIALSVAYRSGDLIPRDEWQPTLTAIKESKDADQG